jgi:hypothetical protein
MNLMTIPKKNKGVPFSKKEKETNPSKKTSNKISITKENIHFQKKWQKNVKIEFEDEFLNNSLQINNILE